MPDQDTPLYRHVIAALVANEPGVLAHVAGMFAARGFNIDSLVVGRTENRDFSRMTIVVTGDMQTLDQVRKQLAKLVEVVKVVDYSEADFVERDLALIRVTASKQQRTEIIELTGLFRGRVVDVAPGDLMIEMSGTESKLEAFIELLEPFGITELARTGIIAMPRGEREGGRSPSRSMSAPASGGGHRQADDDVDSSSLPPG